MATKKVTREAALAAAEAYSVASSALQTIEADKKLKMAEVHKLYEFDVQDHSEALAEAEAIVKAYVEQERPAIFPKDAKSVKFGPVKIGFRKSPTKLVTLEDVTWDNVLAAAKKLLPKYVRRVDDLERDKILKDAAQIGEEKLQAIGVKLSSEEKFFISF